MCWPTHRRALAVLALSLALLAALGAGTASALSLVPKKPIVFFGVSDQGSTDEFFEFEEAIGKHPGLLETFHPWGNSLNSAFERWKETGVRPVLHISTFDDETLEELITPREIALGTSDNYLLQLSFFFSRHHLRAYIRPLGEPNRCLNPYSAVNCDGSKRGGDHTTRWYKQAFRRISAIVRGGKTLRQLNATLAGIGLPPLNRKGGKEPKELPASPVSIIWSPLPTGSPRAPGNFPGNYWPGRRWVDWVGTDFYSQYAYWRDLNRFFRRPLWRNVPFALTEWAVAEEDDARFIARTVHWVLKRPRVRMLIYYRGFGGGDEGNQYDLDLYPRTKRMIRYQARRGRFLPYVPAHAGTLPEEEEDEKNQEADGTKSSASPN